MVAVPGGARCDRESRSGTIPRLSDINVSLRPAGPTRGHAIGGTQQGLRGRLVARLVDTELTETGLFSVRSVTPDVPD